MFTEISWFNCMNVNYTYLVLGKTCFHLDPLDPAMVLLQTGKSIARAAFRCKSVSDHCFPDVTYCYPMTPFQSHQQPNHLEVLKLNVKL